MKEPLDITEIDYSDGNNNLGFSRALLSGKPTHFSEDHNANVKIYVSTRGRTLYDGSECFSADIMDGPSKGKGTTVFTKNLHPVKVLS